MSLKVIPYTWRRLLHPNVYFSDDTSWPTFTYQERYMLFLFKCPETTSDVRAVLLSNLFEVKLCSGSSLARSWVQHLTLPFPAAYVCLAETLKKDDLSQQIIQAFDFLCEEDVIRTRLSSKAHKGESLVTLHDSPATEKSCGRKEREFVGPALRMDPASTTALRLLNSYLHLNSALVGIRKRKLNFC